ncbi:hypothetical protein M378DRAFT_168336 [Amanita muscaria Koide BX008]|uniref:Uncharacterized protein n=1 Tax=Amanita muscaria (strain Koide BX008) TaxID=946122 RepID=A0A0C2SBI0_AMAMK|nr:hypothetical protein M378DRAFT_168336 [Amanita muscaria Koide BX008]
MSISTQSTFVTSTEQRSNLNITVRFSDMPIAIPVAYLLPTLISANVFFELVC